MCVPRTCYCDDTINWALGSHGCIATKGKKHLRRYLHNIKLKIMYVECLLTIVWYFYLNVLLFVWVGNETFAHWRQLPGSLWAGVCDYD